MRPPPEASDEDQLQWLADKKKSSGFENTIESPNLKWHGSGSWIARDRKPEETTLAEKAPETFAESVDRTVSALFSSGETNDTVGALPTGFKPVEKRGEAEVVALPAVDVGAYIKIHEHDSAASRPQSSHCQRSQLATHLGCGGH